MRLLHSHTDGLSLTSDIRDRDLPRYAILSHTWGAVDDEVSYEDMVLGGSEDKPGYRKIEFCAKQAAQDGLEYFWVDSCCINKADMTELSRSINSMFRWYQNAEKCYVYLEDVSVPKTNDGSTAAQESKGVEMQQPSSLWALRESRWFTRAWTLQEMLAPASVEFFSTEGILLGDKHSLESTIHKITGIPILALRGSSLFDFSVEDRFQWAEIRQATLEEDLAYCLLGLFGVFLPLIYGEGRESAQRRLKTEIINSRRALDILSQPTTSRTWWVPFERNEAFTGREAELQRLYKALVSERKKDQTARMTLTGLGGMGKTQVASEFCYRTRAEHEHVLWMSAATKEALAQSYRDVAAELKIPGWDKPNMAADKLVHDFLSRDDTGPWLLVFDNVDDDAMWSSEPCSKSLPKSNRGSILFTTRNTKLAVKLTGKHIVEVTEMASDDSLLLLRAHLSDPELIDEDPETTAAVLERLTNLPLAIVQASMYINTNDIGLEDYIELLNEQDESEVIAVLSEGFEDEGRYEYSGSNTARHPVAKTWLISFEQIRTQHPQAADYLSFMACLSPAATPPSLLPPLASRKLHVEAMGLLKGYSFITSQKPSANASINMHRLVRLATRNWLRQRGSLDTTTDQTVEQLSDKLLRITLADRDVWKPYIPHAMYAFETKCSHDGSPPITMANLHALFLASRFGYCLYIEGRYADAETCLKAAKSTWMAWKGAHFQTRDVMNSLALALEAQDREDEAIALYWEALAQKSELPLDKDDRQIPAIWGNLVCALGKKGLMAEAEAESSKLIAAMEETFDEEDQQTLGVMNNLAGLYYDQKRFSDSIELHRKVLEIRRRALGSLHTDTIISMNNLASSYRENGQLEEMERLYGEALDAMKQEEKKQQNQKKKPETQQGLSFVEVATVAGMERQTGPKAMEVRELLNRRMFGEEHPSTLASMHGLAVAWKGGGREAEALSKMKDCVEARKRVLGPDHPDTLASEETLLSWDRGGLFKKVESFTI